LVFGVAGEFFRQVELTLSISDAERHYHVPLLVAPYACTTYRGS
jgi:5-hydroxyisourate hydrolase